MKKYNHAYDIAFSLESSCPTGENVTAQELITALKARIADVESSSVLWKPSGHLLIPMKWRSFKVKIEKIQGQFLGQPLTVRQNPMGKGWLATLDYKPKAYKGLRGSGDTPDSAIDNLQGKMIDAIPV